MRGARRTQAYSCRELPNGGKQEPNDALMNRHDISKLWVSQVATNSAPPVSKVSVPNRMYLLRGADGISQRAWLEIILRR